MERTSLDEGAHALVPALDSLSSTSNAVLDVDIESMNEATESEDAHQHCMSPVPTNEPQKFVMAGSFRVATEEEATKLKHVAQASLAIYGSILFWVGTWDLIAGCCGPSKYFANRPIWYFCMGTILCLSIDTLYANGGQDSTFLPPRLVEQPNVIAVRSVLGLVGGVVLWVGAFNCMNDFIGPDTENEYYIAEARNLTRPFHGWRDFQRVCKMGYAFVPNSATYTNPPTRMAPEQCPSSSAFLVKDVALLIGGWLLMWLCGSLYSNAGIYPSDIASGNVCSKLRCSRGGCGHGLAGRHPLNYEHDICAHAARTLVALTGLFASCASWLGAWDILEYYSPGSIWREVAYWLLGLLLWLLTKTFFHESRIRVAEQYEEDPQPSTFVFFGRVMLAHVAQLAHIVGVWTLFDEYAWEASNERNWIYAAVGVLMIALSGTLLSNACITPITIVPRRPLSELFTGQSWQSTLMHAGVSLPGRSAMRLRQARMGMMSEMGLTSAGRAQLRASIGPHVANALFTHRPQRPQTIAV